MVLTTTETISGKELETLGLVKGSTIQSKNIGRDIMSGLKTLVGGELQSYTAMMNEARALATKRMVEEAQALGADAIVCVRYASSAAGRRHGRDPDRRRRYKQQLVRLVLPGQDQGRVEPAAGDGPCPSLAGRL